MTMPKRAAMLAGSRLARSYVSTSTCLFVAGRPAVAREARHAADAHAAKSHNQKASTLQRSLIVITKPLLQYSKAILPPNVSTFVPTLFQRRQHPSAHCFRMLLFVAPRGPSNCQLTRLTGPSERLGCV
jgi:hypothetical protein